MDKIAARNNCKKLIHHRFIVKPPSFINPKKELKIPKWILSLLKYRNIVPL